MKNLEMVISIVLVFAVVFSFAAINQPKCYKDVSPNMCQNYVPPTISEKCFSFKNLHCELDSTCSLTMLKNMQSRYG